MSLNIELLEESFGRIKPVGPAFVSDFYKTLLTDNPQLKPLFAHTDMQQQEQKLMFSLVLLIENLRNPDYLRIILINLGERHVSYGCLQEHYPMVGAALLKTFESYLKSDWTSEIKQAWADAYGAIVEMMLEGAKNAEEARPWTTATSQPTLIQSGSVSSQNNSNESFTLKHPGQLMAEEQASTPFSTAYSQNNPSEGFTVRKPQPKTEPAAPHKISTRTTNNYNTKSVEESLQLNPTRPEEISNIPPASKRITTSGYRVTFMGENTQSDNKGDHEDSDQAGRDSTKVSELNLKLFIIVFAVAGLLGMGLLFYHSNSQQNNKNDQSSNTVINWLLKT